MPPNANGSDDDRQTGSNAPESVIVDSNLTMKGELEFSPESDLVVLGSVTCTSIRGVRNLSIDMEGSVSGRIESVTAEIAGTLTGRAFIADTVYLRRTARVRGEVTARWVKVEQGTNLEGCVLSGKIRRAEGD